MANYTTMPKDDIQKAGQLVVTAEEAEKIIKKHGEPVRQKNHGDLKVLYYDPKQAEKPRKK
jgi:hypothetical protein